MRLGTVTPRWPVPLLLLVLAALATTTASPAPAPESHCSVHHTDCVACTEDSLFGLPCRFCPVDQQCHDPGAVLTNPCASAQNIKNPSQCSNSKPPIPYNESLAHDMLVASAAAYSKDAQGCLTKQTAAPALQGLKVLVQQDVPCPKLVNWTGTNFVCSAYVAASPSLVVLAYRGTVDPAQLQDEAFLTLATYLLHMTVGGQSVGMYWGQVYNLLDQVVPAFAQAAAACPSCEHWVTGHSLGAAVASIAATELGPTMPQLVQYTFGQPRVGFYEYAYQHDMVRDAAVPHSYRVVHYNDIVPHLPWCRHVKIDDPDLPIPIPLPICASWSTSLLPAWYHHGTEVFYDEPMAKYITCHGLPHNEDLTSNCSDALYADMVIPGWDPSMKENHVRYFGMEVGGFCDGLSK